MKDKLKEIAAALKAGGSVEHAINALLKLADEMHSFPVADKKPAATAKPAAPPVAKKK